MNPVTACSLVFDCSQFEITHFLEFLVVFVFFIFAVGVAAQLINYIIDDGEE